MVRFYRNTVVNVIRMMEKPPWPNYTKPTHILIILLVSMGKV